MEPEVLNETLTGLVAIIAGYLLGSLPSAYLVTRLATGRDIRKMVGGNVGALNTLDEVGVLPAVVVIILDVTKGAASVAVAYRLLGLADLSEPWVLLAGLAAIAGHMWMVWLRFSGGRGLGTTIGTLAVAFPVYGYWQGVLIFVGVAAVPLAITRNVALSFSFALASLPIIAWLGVKSGLFAAWTVLVGLMLGLKFLPTARRAWAQSRNKKDFIFDRRR